MERSSGEHGKGFFWSVDEQYERTFEEQEAKAQSLAQSQAQSQLANEGPTGGKDGKKKKGVPLDPPLKRSVKSGNGPLPPPLTSTPLPLPSGTATTSPRGLGSVQELGGATVPLVKAEPVAPANIGGPSSGEQLTAATLSASSSAGVGATNGPATASPLAALPASVRLPIVVGTVPSSSSAPSSTEDPPPIVLHDNTLILSPLIFSSLAPDHLKALEEMGAQRALEILQGHIVRYLKERMGRRKKRKANGEKDAKKGDGKVDGQERSSLFTTVPLPPRGGQPAPRPTPQKSEASTLGSQISPEPLLPGLMATGPDFRNDYFKYSASEPAEVKEGVPASVDSKPPVPVPIYTITNLAPITGSSPEGPASPIIIVDDEDEDDGRVTKKRRIDASDRPSLGSDVAMNTDAMQVIQPVDEDIEVDVC